MIKVYELPEVKACYEITAVRVCPDDGELLRFELDAVLVVDIPYRMISEEVDTIRAGGFLVVTAEGIIEYVTSGEFEELYAVLPDIEDMCVGDLLIIDPSLAPIENNETRH